ELVARQPDLREEPRALPYLCIQEQARLLDQERAVVRGPGAAGVEVGQRRVPEEAHVLEPRAREDVLAVQRELGGRLAGEVDRVGLLRRWRASLSALQGLEPRAQAQDLLPHGRGRRRIVGQFLGRGERRE